ncbi:MAG: C39 family peptidase, partial [Oscillospiraceae bacterium]|nr:C39 family peptidase [Oscillospiraceae bacterium]
MSICHQENDYYCVPACVRSMLMYINGSSPSQSSIASSLGTTSSDGTNPTTIAPYLNSKQNNCYYVYYASPTQSYLC